MRMLGLGCFVLPDLSNRRSHRKMEKNIKNKKDSHMQ